MSLSSNCRDDIILVRKHASFDKICFDNCQFHLSVFEAVISLASTDHCSLCRAPQLYTEYEIELLDNSQGH